jgi:hypothetical protein
MAGGRHEHSWQQGKWYPVKFLHRNWEKKEIGKKQPAKKPPTQVCSTGEIA